MNTTLEDWKKECLKYEVMGGQFKGRVVAYLFLEKPIEKRKEIIEFVKKGVIVLSMVIAMYPWCRI